MALESGCSEVTGLDSAGIRLVHIIYVIRAATQPPEGEGVYCEAVLRSFSDAMLPAAAAAGHSAALYAAVLARSRAHHYAKHLDRAVDSLGDWGLPAALD